MHEISRKTGNVAAYPWKMDLQLFGEDDNEAPSIDEGSSYVEDPVETVETNESDVESEQAETPEVAEPEQRERQDSETNKAFQEMRKKMDALEKEKNIARKYGQYNVFEESDISRIYGAQGIHTFDQLDKAIEAQRREQERQKWIDEGMDPDRVEALVDEKLANHPSVVAAKEAEFNNMLSRNYEDLTAEYPDLVKSPDDITQDVWNKWNSGKNGISLADAYTLVNRKEIAAKQQAAVKQAALNNMNSKNHMKPNGSDGSGSPDLTLVPDDVMAMYREMNRKLPKHRQLTEDQMRQHYKKEITK